jgi:hypothetical protein
MGKEEIAVQVSGAHRGMATTTPYQLRNGAHRLARRGWSMDICTNGTLRGCDAAAAAVMTRRRPSAALCVEAMATTVKSQWWRTQIPMKEWASREASCLLAGDERRRLFLGFFVRLRRRGPTMGED